MIDIRWFSSHRTGSEVTAFPVSRGCWEDSNRTKSPFLPDELCIMNIKLPSEGVPNMKLSLSFLILPEKRSERSVKFKKAGFLFFMVAGPVKPFHASKDCPGPGLSNARCLMSV